MTALELVRAEVYKRTRFKGAETLINVITDDEVDAAIHDALQDINSHEPSTSYTLEEMWNTEDKRWKRLLYLGASRNIVSTLILDWTANGLDIDLGDGVATRSKMSDYRILGDNLQDQFETLLGRLKTTSERYNNLSQWSTSPGPLTIGVATRLAKYRRSTRS